MARLYRLRMHGGKVPSKSDGGRGSLFGSSLPPSYAPWKDDFNLLDISDTPKPIHRTGLLFQDANLAMCCIHHVAHCDEFKPSDLSDTPKPIHKRTNHPRMKIWRCVASITLPTVISGYRRRQGYVRVPPPSASFSITA